ncbi:DUF2142 domain-containing protein [Geodermatophilus sp. SYSU D00815]
MKISLRRPSEGRRWLVAFVLFSTLGGLWGLSSPLFSVPDEPAHTVYAAAAVRGEVWAPMEDVLTTVTVPADIAQAGGVPSCYAFSGTITAECAPQYGGRSGEAEAVTYVGHYPPAYYLYAGLPTLVASGKAAVYLMRALTAVLVGALLASATCSALATRRPRTALAGLGLATTPMLLFFAGAVNPQGPEIAAAISLWAAGFVLLTRLREEHGLPLTWREPALRRSLVAIVLLTLMRPMSLLWLTLIVVALLALLGTREGLLRLLRSRAVLSAVPVVAVTAGSTFVWILLRDALTLAPMTFWEDMAFPEAAATTLTSIDRQLGEMVGVFGWLDTPLPPLLLLAFTVALVALGTLSLAGAERRALVVLAVLLAVVLLLPSVLQLMTYRESGLTWQGRYVLPLAVGLPLLLGLLPATGERGVPTRRVVALVAGVFVLVQAGALVWAVNRYVNGVDGFYRLLVGNSGPWAPPFPVPVLALAGLAVTVACAVLALRAEGPAPATTADEPAAGADEHAPTAPPRLRSPLPVPPVPEPARDRTAPVTVVREREPAV